jgi:MFS-type transporter involved in bile tolerance (Atg22 family)
MLLIALINGTPAYQLGVYRMREQLHFSAETFGLVLAFGAAGGIVGSLMISWLRRWFGIVPTILIGAALWSFFSLIYASSLPSWVFMLAEALIGACSVINQITILTLRQSLTPDYLMGRVQSVGRLMAWSLIPVGAVIGTALADPLGATPVIIGACVLGTLASLGMFLSPVRHIQEKAR